MSTPFEYQIISTLHEGIQTIVYRIRVPHHQQPTILKLLLAEYPTLEAMTRLKQEYHIQKDLDHPGIVKVVSIKAFEHRLGLLLEDFGGNSLAELLQTTQLNLITCLNIAIQLTKVLDYLHKNQIIHKDIKPSNIIINEQTGMIKLTDFGIASRLNKENHQFSTLNSIEGTLTYMSPEQTGRMNRNLDYRTDFYSLGVTLYEMITGKLPFESSDPLEIVYSHIAGQPVLLHSLDTKIPRAISEIVMKLMAKNAEDRYQSAAGILADLENCLEQLETKGNITDFIAGSLDILSQLLIPQKMYGRERQVTELLAAFERVANGSSELILVLGYSGIGKSAVVNEVNKPITRKRGYFISGKFDQFKRNIPYASLIQAFGYLMRQLLTENTDILQKWCTRILAALGENGQVIINVIPEVELIIGKQPEVAQLGATESQNRFNRVFKEFIHVFTSHEHPLVIFLDDLQWADSATLKFMELLMSDPDNKYLLFIGAYRDNEVSLTHPLMHTIEEIQKSGTVVNNIVLQPLDLKNVTQLITDTLNKSHKLQFLAQLIYNKTGGNPFFITQLLQALYQEDLLRFDFNYASWNWDLSEIQAIGITEKSVVELVASRIQKLPEDTQKLLKIAACMGDRFTLDVLSIVNEQSPSTTASELYSALQAGLILPLSDTYRIPLVFKQEEATHLTFDSSQVGYKFLHDRVQQAAYSLIPEDQKKSIHQKIGRLILQNTPTEELESYIFDIVNQLNYGVDLMTQQIDRHQLAQLNLIAGRKAQISTAYTDAVRYLSVGIGLLADDSWKSQYELTCRLYESAVEAAYLNGDFEQLEQLADTVLQQAKTLLEKVKVYEVQIIACIVQSKQLEAITIARSVLQLLGVNFPQQATSADIEQGMDEVAANLNGKAIADLISLPTMKKAENIAAMKILMGVLPAGFQTAPEMVPIIACKMVNLSIKDGNTAVSAYGYSIYGLILCGVRGEIDSGYEFGKLALNLVSRFNTRELKAKILTVVSAHVIHWKEHVRETFSSAIAGYSSGLETGDLEYAGYCGYIYPYHSFWSGKELGEMERELAAYCEALGKIKQQVALTWNQIYWQTVLNLRKESSKLSWCLTGPAYDEQRMLPLHEQANDLYTMNHLFVNKLMLCYLFGKYPQALDNAARAENSLGGVTGLFVVPLFYFYDSLVRLAIYSTVPEDEQNSLLEKVRENQKKMELWATHAPTNHLHKFYLVAAEIHRVIGQNYQAMDDYDRAINGAAENGYIQEEALAYELAGDFYKSLGKEIIYQVYMTKSYYKYINWGSVAKVQHLESKHHFLVAQTRINEAQERALSFTKITTINTINTTQNNDLGNFLDVSTFVKLSQAITSEIVLKNLLNKLIKIILENAVAQKAVLLLIKNEQLYIEATGIADGDVVTVLQSIPLETSHDLPISVVNYVFRTKHNLVLNDATVDEIFNTDTYIQQFQTKSIICLPIFYQSKLMGIIYLENNLTVAAFAQERVEILKVLVSQVAIAIENASLYGREQEKSRQLEQSLNDLQQAQLQLIQKEKMSSLGNLVAGVAHEINNPVGFIVGTINNAMDSVKDLINHLQIYQEELPNPSPTIMQNAEDIDLEYLLEDLPKMLSSMEVACDRIRSISTSLRTFSRADTTSKASANIHDGLESTLMILQHRLKAQPHRPAIQVIKRYGNIPSVDCYLGQLNQVFMNLLANAIDALEESHSGRPSTEIKANTITIETKVSEDKRSVVIKIQDNGNGMPEEVKSCIFDHLFTTKRIGEGTGLGLSISRQIVEETHSGSLTCESVLGEGTEFTICIPCSPSD